ncbi:TolC family protein [Pontimicrobium sp. IMCC45349]|uniref:TolC family protein n=1 Tax=Pontimicrobium sp. IMCC45349 TaxID=3391574 RepID=UPI0039A26219
MNTVLSLAEYMSYVKTYHPLIKQANLVVTDAESQLLQARGAFDPKIEVDYNHKTFKNTEYYDKLNAAFKIPTWFGIELKGQIEQNEGVYLNPENNVPIDGLYNLGISIPLAKGLLTNKRMAMLKQSKVYIDQSKETQKLLVNNTLYNAIVAYFDWLRFYNESQIYLDYLNNASQRFEGIKQNYFEGQAAAIDTTEAHIAILNRKQEFENAQLKLKKAQLKLSNYLWIQNTPVELSELMIPDTNTLDVLDRSLNLETNSDININSHPKIQALQLKQQHLEIERRLQKNNLLPTINFNYNFLTETPNQLNSLNIDDYKLGLQVSIPLFLRKERGKFQLVNNKIQSNKLDLETEKVNLKTKISAIQEEINSYSNQYGFSLQMVNSYKKLLQAEERKYQIGESSIFLINSRESKLINVQLKVLELNYKLMHSKAKMFNSTIFNNS